MSLLEQIMASLRDVVGQEALAVNERANAGYHLEVTPAPEKLLETASLLDQQGFFLEFVTAVDKGENLDVVYMFSTWDPVCRVKLGLPTPKGQSVPSLANLIPAADWHERETFDMLGQVFEGHPDPRRILLPEDADFHPLLKDFQAVPGPAEA